MQRQVTITKDIQEEAFRIYEPKKYDWMGYPISKSKIDYIPISYDDEKKTMKKVISIEESENKKTVSGLKKLLHFLLAKLQKKFISKKSESDMEVTLENIAIVSKTSVEKLAFIKMHHPGLYAEYIYMFHIINDMKCPPTFEIKTLMNSLKIRLEAVFASEEEFKNHKL